MSATAFQRRRRELAVEKEKEAKKESKKTTKKDK